MNEPKRRNMSKQNTEFTQNLIDQVARLDGGPELLELLALYDVSVKTTADYTDEGLDTSDIAFLHINNGVNTLYLSPICQADDLVHELTHIHHIFGLPQDLVTPTDLKHRYITKAMREADAFARQMKAFLETLNNPQNLERERAVFEQAQYYAANPEESEGFHIGAGKVFLYTIAGTSPDEIVRMINESETTADELMLDVFCTVLHDFVPLQYNEHHLDQLNAELNSRIEDNDLITRRAAPCTFHSKDDALFFADCLREYGSWGRGDNYLISPEGLGPDPSVFLDVLFDAYITEVIDDMNAQLPTPNAHIEPPAGPQY